MLLDFQCGPRRLLSESRLWLDFRAPERPRSRSWNHRCTNRGSDFSAPQTSPFRISALAGTSEPRRGLTGGGGIPRRSSGSRLWLVRPSIREGRQEEEESLVQPVVLRFQGSPDVSLQDLGSGWISTPQRGPTVAVLIISAPRNARFLMLPRRLHPGSQLCLDFQAPERASRGF